MIAYDLRLQAVADVTLVDNKDYFEVAYGNVRACVEPAFSEKTLWPHSLRLGNAKLVVGRATALNLEQKSVTVEGADKTLQSVAFDYLVIATGQWGARGSIDPATGGAPSAAASVILLFFFWVGRYAGSNYATLGKGDASLFGATIPEHRKWFEETARRIEKASSILFLGGGPVRGSGRTVPRRCCCAQRRSFSNSPGAAAIGPRNGMPRE